MSLMKEEILSKLQKTISDAKGIAIDDITYNTSFNQLSLDSLDLVELVVMVKKAYGVSLKPEELVNFNNIEDVCNCIERVSNK
ncbi:acyl carrier protein [Escherichia coli]|uniref:acyl carrier protein n=1 Tax=Escherichia coli TaxID=562 RepID=UPI0022B57FFC|nr:acyl carrier protein [Escherichia coli]ELR5715088.1 acyl carrier protein [Escherichia coli]MCZ5139889.1 acyl carrier protein [Escherichia coli]MCZ6323801.1 acyl carrier protein [Escherichia coli]